MSYKIEVREFGILGGLGGHYYFALYDSNGEVIDLLHGLATDRKTKVNSFVAFLNAQN